MTYLTPNSQLFALKVINKRLAGHLGKEVLPTLLIAPPFFVKYDDAKKYYEAIADTLQHVGYVERLRLEAVPEQPAPFSN